MGRTSTDDQQDPTLSLPRQLDNCRRALPAPFVIVAKFYDIESGRNDLELRGHGDEDIDAQWRTTLQRRFAELAAEHRAATNRLAALNATAEQRGPGRSGDDPTLLDRLPHAAIDPTVLPAPDQRDPYDAFHLQVRYHRPEHRVTLRVTVHAEAVPILNRKGPRAGPGTIQDPRTFPYVCAPGPSRPARGRPG